MIVKLSRVKVGASWGVIDQATGKFMEKYGECGDAWSPGLSIRTGKRQTGLTGPASKKDINTFKLESTATLADKFEKQLNLAPGTLAINSDYWLSYKIIIPVGGLKLDDSVDTDQLKIALLTSAYNVASGLAEAKTSTKFEYVLTTEGAEAIVRNNKRDIIANAYSLFAKLSVVQTNDALYMFGKNPDTTSPAINRNVLGDILEKNPKKFLDTIGDIHFNEKVKIIKMVSEGVIRKATSGVGFDMPLLFGDIPLGTGLDEVIAFLLEKGNSQIYVALNKAYDTAIK